MKALIGRLRWTDYSRDKATCGRTAVRLLLAIIVTLPWLARGSVDARLAIEDYEIIGEALHATDMDEWSRAFRLMDGIEDQLALKLFRWLVLVEDKKEASFDDLARFILDSPNWPKIEELQALAESRLTDSADQELTIQLFEDREPLTTRGRIRLAEALFAADRDEEAVQQIKRAWKRGDYTSIEEKSFLTRHQRHLSRYDHETRLENLLWDRSWAAIKRMLPRVSNDRQKLAKARLALQQRARGVDGAIAAVPAAFTDDPGLAYDRTRWRRQKGKHQDARTLLLDPPENLGRPDRWWFERSYQIRRAIDRREFETAYKLASRHGQSSGGDYAEAEWLAGWLTLRFMKRPKTAFRHFVRLYDRVVPPVRQARAAYWAGRAASAQRDQAGATAWYRRAASHHLTYYGQLAAEELDERTLIRKPMEPTGTERAAFDSSEVARVARMLIAAGASNHLDVFLRALSNHAETAAEMSMITDLAVAGGRPALLVQIGRKAAFKGKVYDAAAFPVPRIDGLLKPAAEAVEAPLLLGLARQESMFRSRAASTAGARGLLQLLPSTARIVAKKVGEDFDLDRLSADPDYNAALGSHYLASMLKRFDDEPALALAAYNAGPLRVKQWIKRHGDPRTGNRHDVVDWIELIPFDETRNYVQRVLEGYHAYKLRLASSDVALIDYPGSDGLYPPPIPRAKPRDDLATGSTRTGDAAALSADHVPLFKPATDVPGSSGRIVVDDAVQGNSSGQADIPLSSVAKTFNDLENQDMAVDEQDTDGIAAPLN
ncbi:MAG: transglycosylase SLT domain-containing protein [Geminicoccales bacterium]